MSVVETFARFSRPKVRMRLEVEYGEVRGVVEEFGIRCRVELGFQVPGKYGRAKTEVLKGIVRRFVGLVVKAGVRRIGRVVEGDLEVWMDGEGGEGGIGI